MADRGGFFRDYTRAGRTALMLALVAASPVALAETAPQTPSAFSDAQRSEIETLISSYLRRNPEVVIEAQEIFLARQQAAETDRQKQFLNTRRKELFEDPATPTLGAAQPDVTIVEFFDYQCGYCKMAFMEMNKLLEQDSKVRVAMKEYPILGPASLVAAKAALAARVQGRYAEFHRALITQKGRLDDELIFKTARSAGLDVDKLRKDMEAPEIQLHLAANRALADGLGLSGTPAFIIGQEVFPGAIRFEDMKRKVAAARGAGKS